MDLHANFANSTVAAAPSPAISGTSLDVRTGDGQYFPVPPFNASVIQANVSHPTPGQAEVVRVTNIGTDTFTITRAQEGSSARSIQAGDRIVASITAKSVTDVEVALAALTSSTATSFTFPTPFQYNSRKLDIRARNYLAMRNARAQLARGALTGLWLGDSITECSSLTNTYDCWPRRVTDVFANSMTAQSPGVGYMPMATVNSSGLNATPSTPLSPASNFWTHTGALGDLSANGLGQRGILTAAGSTSASTATVNCSSFDLFYNKKNTFGGITVTVDGGAPITIDANGTSTITMAKWNSHTDGGLTLTSGSHTVAIATTNAGVTNATFLNDIAGVFFYLDNEASGARCYEGGHPTYPSQNTQTRELQQIALIQPDVVFIAWGANDFAFSIIPTSTAANFASIVSSINGVCTVAPTFVFVATWGNGSGSTEATWITYRDAIFQQAITSGAAYVDMYERLGWQGSTTTLQDGIAHPNVAGSKAYADAVIDALGLATGQSPDGALHSGALPGGGNWSISDVGLNTVGLGVQTSNADPFASLYVGTFAGAPTLGLGPRTTLFDTSLGRSDVGVFSVNNALKLTGLTGATAVGRLVGTTADVAPTTGTFNTGDFVHSRTGRVWICTAGGSPGTWIEPASALVPLLAGRSGGQTLYGGTSATESLALHANAADAFGQITLNAPQGLVVTSAEGQVVQQIIGVATNDDVIRSDLMKRGTTTSATVLTLGTVTVPTDTVMRVEATVIGRRTGGTDVTGAAGDVGGYKIAATYKNVTGTVTQVGTTTIISTHEADTRWDATLDASGTTARVRVTGATNVNITWHGIIVYSSLST